MRQSSGAGRLAGAGHIPLRTSTVSVALSNHAVAKCLRSLLGILSSVKRSQRLRSCRCEVPHNHVVVPTPTKYKLEVAQRDPEDSPPEKRGNTALAIPSAHLRIPRLARVLPDNTTSMLRGSAEAGIRLCQESAMDMSLHTRARTRTLGCVGIVPFPVAPSRFSHVE